MYQGGGRPAAASYKSYLTSDAAAAARADGYGLREWRHDSSGALWSVSSGLLVVDTPAVLTCQGAAACRGSERVARGLEPKCLLLQLA
jgi:hypothetical protein